MASVRCFCLLISQWLCTYKSHSCILLPYCPLYKKSMLYGRGNVDEDSLNNYIVYTSPHYQTFVGLHDMSFLHWHCTGKFNSSHFAVLANMKHLFFFFFKTFFHIPWLYGNKSLPDKALHLGLRAQWFILFFLKVSYTDETRTLCETSEEYAYMWYIKCAAKEEKLHSWGGEQQWQPLSQRILPLFGALKPII